MMSKHQQVKGAIILVLIFFSAICYLYSLPMETMTISEIKINFSNVWWRAIHSDQLSEPRLIFASLCETLIGWHYNCRGKEWPMRIRNYTFELWLVYLIAYFFVCVWFLLDIFEALGKKRELQELIKERLEELRSKCSDEILQREIIAQQEINGDQSITKISRVVQLNIESTDCMVVAVPFASQLTEEYISDQRSEDSSASQIYGASNASFEQLVQLKKGYFEEKTRKNAQRFKSNLQTRRRAFSEPDIFDALDHQNITETCSRMTT